MLLIDKAMVVGVIDLRVGIYRVITEAIPNRKALQEAINETCPAKLPLIKSTKTLSQVHHKHLPSKLNETKFNLDSILQKTFNQLNRLTYCNLRYPCNPYYNFPHLRFEKMKLFSSHLHDILVRNKCSIHIYTYIHTH